MTQASSPPRLHRLGRIAVLANIFLVLLGIGVLSPVLPQVQDAFAASYTGISWSVGAFAIARLVTDAVSSLMPRWRIGRLTLLVAGALAVATGAATSAFAGSLLMFVVGRAVTGIGSGLCTTIGLMVMMDNAPADRRAREASWYWSALTGGVFFGPGMGGALALVGGWRAAMLGASCAGLLSAALFGVLALRGLTGGFAWVRSDTTSAEAAETAEAVDAAEAARAARAAVRPALIAVFSVVVVLFFVRGGIQQTLVPLMASATYGLGATGIAVLLMVAAGLATVLGPVVGSLADRHGTRVILLVAVAMLSFGTIGLVSAPSLPGFVAGALILGVAGTVSGIPPSVITSVSSGARRSRLLSAYRVTGDLAMAVAPLATGVLMEHASFLTAGLTVGAFALCAVVPIVLAERARAALGVRPAT